MNTPLILFLLIFTSTTFQASNRPSFWSNFSCRSAHAVIAPEQINRRLSQSPNNSFDSKSSENFTTFDDDYPKMQLFTQEQVQTMTKKNNLKTISLRSHYERIISAKQEENNILENTNSDQQRMIQDLNWQLHAARLVNSECNIRLPDSQKFNNITNYSKSIRSGDVIMSLQTSNYDLRVENEAIKNNLKTAYNTLAQATKSTVVNKEDLIVLESRMYTDLKKLEDTIH